jgi:hypothetical protein
MEMYLTEKYFYGINLLQELNYLINFVSQLLAGFQRST